MAAEDSSDKDRFAADLRGFGALGLLAIVVIVLPGNVPVAGLVLPVSGMLVLLWRAASHTPWREIGYVRPRSWIGDLGLGMALGMVLKLLLKAVVMPLLGADPINHAYHYLVENTAALPAAVFAMIVAAAFGEETTFRGFLFERFGKLFGPGWVARTATVLVTSAWFSLSHLSDQGLAGAEQAAVTGLVMGSIFAATGRIWLPMCVHAAYDLTALVIIYLDREAEVAHWLFA
jgi:membrane protease YdiL (CAAX protease family)